MIGLWALFLLISHDRTYCHCFPVIVSMVGSERKSRVCIRSGPMHE